MEPADGVAVLSASPRPRRTVCPFRLHLLDAVRRRVREPNVVVSADEESGRTGGRVVDGLADSRIDKLDHGADDVAGRPELAQLARLPDLAEHVLEEIALGVGVDPLKVEVVHLAHDLGEHRRLVDDETRALHEVSDSSRRDLGVERKHFLANPGDQLLAVERVRPRGPAKGAARDHLLARRAGVPRIAEGPLPIEGARVGLRPGTARGADAGRVRRPRTCRRRRGS